MPLEKRSADDICEHLAPERATETVAGSDQLRKTCAAILHRFNDLTKRKGNAFQESSRQVRRAMSQRQTDEAASRSRIHDRRAFTHYIGKKRQPFAPRLDFTGKSVNEIVLGLIGDYLDGPGRELIEHGMTNRAKATYKDALDKLAEM